MAIQRVPKYVKVPWNGGLNTSVDGGVLNDSDLVIADNVVFITEASRRKREGLEYLDTNIPTPTFRSSSGTTKTVYVNAALQSTDDDILVAGEVLAISSTISGEDTYETTSATVTSVGSSAQQTKIVVTASDPDGEYFTLYDSAGSVAFWIDVDNSGTAEPGHGADRSVEITTITTAMIGNANSIASEIRDAINADAAFSASVSSAEVTVTDAANGFRTAGNIGTTDYTITTILPGTTNGVLTYTGSGSLTEGVTATSTLTLKRGAPYLMVKDYWYESSNSKVQRVVAMNEQGLLFTHDEGERKQIAKDAGATAISGTLTYISSLVYNNTLIVCMSGVGNKPIKYRLSDSANWEDLGGTPPDASFMMEHQDRVWANDKTNKDRLHYTSTGNHEEWGGTGDSGALDIGIGDGDEDGITAIFPTFNGELFVSKGAKLYRISGDAPENYRIRLVSNGIGCTSHNAVVPVDQTDQVFISKRGVHSLAATDTSAEYDSTYLSRDIQPIFNDLPVASLDNAVGVYIPELSSFALGVTDEASSTGNNQLYLYNINLKAWYRWPNISCRSASSFIDFTDKKRKAVFGTDNSRLIGINSGTFLDFGTDSIQFRVKTGTVYPAKDPTLMVGFKRISLLYRPLGSFAITCRVKVDTLPVQEITFLQPSEGSILGTDFTLGTSSLGLDFVFAPFSFPIDGYGRGCTIELIQTQSSSQVEVYGFAIEYDPVDTMQETLGSRD